MATSPNPVNADDSSIQEATSAEESQPYHIKVLNFRRAIWRKSQPWHFRQMMVFSLLTLVLCYRESSLSPLQYHVANRWV